MINKTRKIIITLIIVISLFGGLILYSNSLKIKRKLYIIKNGLPDLNEYYCGHILTSINYQLKKYSLEAKTLPHTQTEYDAFEKEMMLRGTIRKLNAKYPKRIYKWNWTTLSYKLESMINSNYPPIYVSLFSSQPTFAYSNINERYIGLTNLLSQIKNSEVESYKRFHDVAEKIVLLKYFGYSPLILDICNDLNFNKKEDKSIRNFASSIYVHQFALKKGGYYVLNPDKINE